MNYRVNEEISWAGYSLDGNDVVTGRINTTLTGLSYKTHVIQVYANDSAGNECFSPTIVFTVKGIDPPTISLLSTGNTYNTTDIPLNFALNENVTWIGYSLDNQANVTLARNTTLAGLSRGSRSLIVYANDTAGNIGISQIFDFVVTGSESQRSEPFPTTIIAIASASALAVVSAGSLAYFRKRKRQAKPVS